MSCQRKKRKKEKKLCQHAARNSERKAREKKWLQAKPESLISVLCSEGKNMISYRPEFCE